MFRFLRKFRCRCVSPWRRRIGLIVLILLVVVVAAYNYLTTDARVRAMVESYISENSQRIIHINSASFTLLGGLELRGVRVDSWDLRAKEPVFSAEKINIRHNPWLLLLWQFKIDEVICTSPVISIAHDVDTHASDVESSCISCRPDVEFDRDITLPRIQVHNGKLQILYCRQEHEVARVETSLDFSVVPQEDNLYRILFDEQISSSAGRLTGMAVVNLSGRELIELSVSAPVGRIMRMLPPSYRRHVADLHLKGELEVTRTSPGGRSVAIELKNVTADVPKKIVKMRLGDICGKIIIDQDKGFSIPGSITAKLPTAGGATLKLWGNYGGFTAISPCDIKVVVDNFKLPPSHADTGEIGKLFAFIRKTFQPRGDGRARISTFFVRPKDSDGKLHGVVELLGCSGAYDEFSCRVNNLRGKIKFDQDSVDSFHLVGSREDASVIVSGHVGDFTNNPPFSVTVAVKNGRLIEELRRAIPKPIMKVLKTLKPTGRADCVCKVFKSKQDSEMGVDVSVTLDGRAAIVYDEFPYPLKKIRGKIHATRSKVRLIDLSGRNGKARCKLNGEFKDIDTDSLRANLKIRVKNLPVDNTLLVALDERGRKAIQSLHSSGGVLEEASVHVDYENDTVDYKVTGAVKNASIKAEMFPYAITDVAGELTITPRTVVLKKFTGQHGPAKITLSGKARMGKKDSCLERLVVEMKNVPLDGDLLAALPKDVREECEKLEPRGRADITVSAWHENLANPDKLGYLVIVKPINAKIKYAEFPYPIGGITGAIVASPGQIKLIKMAGSRGKEKFRMDGTITTGQKASADIKLRTSDLKVDKHLIQAISKIAPNLAKRFKPGGTLSLGRKKALRLGFTDMETAASRPLSTTAPTSRPIVQRNVKWRVEGDIAFNGMKMDVGLSSKTLSGKIEGFAGALKSKLKINAALALDSVKVGNQQITSLRGKIIKKSNSSWIVVDDFEGKFHGGLLFGKAHVCAADPIRYSVNLRLSDIDLSNMVNAGSTDPKKRSDIKGLLAGRLRMQATVDDPKSMLGGGILRITKAKISKLPILLGLLNLIELKLPGNNAFSDAHIVYNLRGQTVVFRELNLHGSAVSFIGSGTFDLKADKLNLTFLGGPVGKLPRLNQIAKELIMAIGKELMVVEVTGPLKNPTTKTKMLRSLNPMQYFRKILKPENDSKQ